MAAVRGKLKSLGKVFRKLRGVNEELRQDGDELRERIAHRVRQQGDAERGVVRACAEVKNLDEQLSVSSEVYNTASASHSALSEQLKVGQNRVMETELTWKATVEALATQQREEAKTRTVYESKMAMEEQDLQEAEDTHRQKVSKVRAPAPPPCMLRPSVLHLPRLQTMKVLEASVERADVQEAKVCGWHDNIKCGPSHATSVWGRPRWPKRSTPAGRRW